MKMKIGFAVDNGEKKNTSPVEKIINSCKTAERPVRSVVNVHFKNGREYPYYNDKFNLKVGDVVFVDGKLAGIQGRVTSVTKKFKVSLNYYKRVIAKLNLDIHGEFNHIKNYMLCRGSAVAFEQVSLWFNAPREEEEEFFIGDGYEVLLDGIDKCPDISEKDYEAAAKIYVDNGVKFITVKDGVGKAIVEGDKNYHTVDFTIENGSVKNLYCDCISPDFCRHMTAVCIALYMFFKENAVDEDTDFSAFTNDLFYNVISYNSEKIVL